ncbi:hypothetical protein A3I46_02695 [Candidatus Kaiserbacteria bacterium RIFCSPLOWO2_02_FULL_54_13]|uniref:Uncharacterized protein n=1 Tax=Candidatus Kaiserbacteria bacterium RIFCSPHIGHO2_02_FULL_54_22 TaxID=1798495 RepID=A0A1F6DLM0_9BACT|nr:MAG: hypothetical protein A3C19_03530 [Candidatus Kaiserbacteria bacterium RIFCSPHIGHO2_02_FULL_54_22]OGG68849.1 MAG: hypothetical protein A3E99_02945 [Candidatus Kaiserbacteria bacterium RIFCSPHIGHO2_12_FULL_54_16]OGG83853.1 MAG: hypothetical protein A3I46_02695 [Candidatus Kaiserbacteria bacterium RIFCSPLOWO2_02_FULL_54_13]
MGKLGKTYPEIREKFPIPKSTLSTWFKNAGKKPDRTRQLEHLKRIRPIAVATIHRKKEARVALATGIATRELNRLPLKNKSIQKALLAMLYWAEGAKSDMTGLRFVNTDPVLAKLYISLLRSTYALDERRIRIRLHLHYYHKHREAITFWSKLLKVPNSQFGKIYVKKRSVQRRFRKNFQGICFINYFDGAIRRELLSLGQQVAQKYAE